VEDELLVAMQLEDVLAEQGCEVLEPVCTVADALDAVSRHCPDAVMLDLNLNGTPTVAIAEKLIASSIPFVIVSGFVEAAVTEPILKDAPFVAKPWTQTELLQKLNKALR